MPATPIPKRGARNPVSRFFERAGNFDLLSIFDPKRTRPAPRTVLINVPPPQHSTTTVPQLPVWSKTHHTSGEDGVVTKRKVSQGYGEKQVPSEGWIFESNQVLTSKYNIFTFLPRNLLEQFRRVANVFFLGESPRHPHSDHCCLKVRHPRRGSGARWNALGAVDNMLWAMTRRGSRVARWGGFRILLRGGAKAPLCQNADLGSLHSPRYPPVLPPFRNRIARTRRASPTRRTRNHRHQGRIRGSQATPE